MAHLADLRKDYGSAGLSEGQLAGDPYGQFDRWFRDAEVAGLAEPNAMVLVTATPEGRPSARTVLLKEMGPDQGFVFYTQQTSRKGRELAANPRAALLFPWIAQARQVIVEGPVSPVPRAQAEAYFRRRPRANQLAAWASVQSGPLAGREELERAMAEAESRYAGRDVPMSPRWGGYRVRPETVEFWQGRGSRLHDRLRYRWAEGVGWSIERLSP